jgi:glycerol-3-phosphate acyltransferase PlsY
MAALLVWRHKQNIARLMAGEEPRLGAKKPG